MRTYLHVWALRFRLWRIFGSPLATTVPAWRVVLRKRQSTRYGEHWAFINKIDGQSLEPKRKGIGELFICRLEEAATPEDWQQMLKQAEQQYRETQEANARSLQPQPEPEPMKLPPPELHVAGHQKFWTHQFNGILCQCGWVSTVSSHTLHLADGTCQECLKVWAEWKKHIEAARDAKLITEAAKEQPHL